MSTVLLCESVAEPDSKGRPATKQFYYFNY